MKAFILVTAFIVYRTAEAVLDNPCEDWTPYKDQKCLKIFEAPGLLDYNDAENFCKDQDDSHLISIGVEEEQKFIETYLKTNNVADNIWIGLKYVDNSYQWSDGTELHHTNWAAGNPLNNSDYCIQLEAELTAFGSWSSALCSRKNLVLCEKIQLWSLPQIQTTLVNLIRNPVPIGFIYPQLPKEKSPSEIWSWMEWTDVSSDYDSVFFRVVGQNTTSFGTVQEDDSPRFIRMETIDTDCDYYTEIHVIDIKPDGKPSDTLTVRGSRSSCPSGQYVHDLQVTVSKAEVRPRNMAMRIWKRTA